jgi:hypothetical protein
VIPVALGSKASDYDARLTRFLDELGRLSEGDWATVATRYLAQKKSITVTTRNVDHLQADISSGKVKPFGRTAPKRMVMVRQANAAMHAVTTHLPTTREINGKSIKLQDSAYMAVYHAVNALKVFAEFDRMPGGRDVLRTLLAPFDGLTTSVLT